MATPAVTIQQQAQAACSATEVRIWVFGYGSLMWKPDFSFNQRKVGFVRNYVRRFWQGNTTHRGTDTQPGRVAHLVEEKGSHTWGVAFEVAGDAAVRTAMAYLEQRETTLGGYVSLQMEFHPRDCPDCPFNVLVFSVTPDNPHYLGPAPLLSMAAQIVAARGQAGPNIDYVTRLADFVRREIPEDQDPHLFELDSKVRELQAARLQPRRESFVLKMEHCGHSHNHIATKSCPRGAMY